jgi:hypothetical protein
MTTTTTLLEAPVRTAGWITGAGGLTITALGLVGTAWPESVGGVWFAVTAVAIGLLTVGVGGLRRTVADVTVARRALAATAVTMVLFGLAHLYAVADADRAIPFFSGFMVLSAIGLIVAGAAILRSRIWSGNRRFLPLLTGIWPLATIPAGAAIGDVPHFLAIAVWGICWLALARVLLGTGVRYP